MEQTPTYTTTAERQLLAHLLLDSQQYPIHAPEIKLDYFTGPIERDIFIAYKKLIEAQKEPDSFTISQLIEQRHPNAFIEISNIEETNTFNSNINNLIALLRQKYQIAELKKLGQILYNTNLNQQPEKIIEEAAEKLHQLNSQNQVHKIKEFSQIVNELIEHIEAQQDNELSGIATGIREFDLHTRGLQLQDLVIIGGETSQGKTALAINMIFHAVCNNNPTLFISLEMSQMQLAARAMAMHTKTSAKTILLHKIHEPNKSHIIQKLESARQFPFYIDDTSGNQYQKIINQIRRYVIQKQIRIVVIDYLQLVNFHRPGVNKEQEIGDIARGFKNIAKELNIVVIALSQLSRNKENPKPTLARLRQSGQIEEAADIITFVYRPEYYDYEFYHHNGTDIPMKNAGMCFIAKGRNIGITEFPLNFNKELTQWSDYTHQNENQYDTGDF